MLSPRALPSLAWVLLSCLVLLSQVQGEDSQKEVPSPRISCPKGSKAYASHCYALFTTPKSWMDADGSESNGGGWEWSSTDLLNYLAWEKDPSTITNSGHCGSLSKSTGFLKWKDYNCDTKLPYVCKFKN
ncbi:PREDICTED: regenerating islet-derived protein 3-gamma-like isoform X2 [Propithecus coquereli]|uniref:regenerating islet-derived protein 3-gamma-like isoform X2 n=1 Tax=Propithecus coquereli TaxID=379532 RepID=UPI00063FBF8E|nr:PREDICTED: regenerating islet-derived protein 3-gamma-like isoform X2 [Propithecus coquereli]